MLEIIVYVLVFLVVLLILAARYTVNGGLFRRYCAHIKTSLQGKTVIITGGNAGIGRQTAIDLAQRGARVIIACRNENKAKAALQEIRKKSGSSNVHYYHLELSDQESIRKFAKKFLEEEPRLDILINNAGIGITQGKRTKQDFDMTFGVNHFGHFLLTMLLLERLKKCTPSRIVTVASLAHTHVLPGHMEFTPGALNASSVRYPGLIGYDRSKLANILFTKQLSERLQGTDVTACCLHPGLVRTSIFQTAYETGSPWWRFCLFTLASLILGINESAGAQTTIYCAIDESITDQSGGYYDNCYLTKESKLAQDDGLAKKLWDVSCQATTNKY